MHPLWTISSRKLWARQLPSARGASSSTTALAPWSARSRKGIFDGHPALYYLRQRRRRQIDLDRALALRDQVDLRGSIGGAQGRLEEIRHPGRAPGFRLSGRRIAGGTRAEDHYRCG